MLARRAFLGCAAASAAAWTLDRAAGETLRSVEIRIRVTLPPAKGAARVWISPPAVGDVVLSAETVVDGDADVVDVEGRPAALIAARWRAGATGPWLQTTTRAVVRGSLTLERLALVAPRAETLSGPVDWNGPSGARWRVTFDDVMA